MTVVTTSALGLQPEDNDSIAIRTARGSAFQAATPQGSISYRGKVRRTLTIAGDPNFSVVEGGTKPVIDPVFGKEIIMPSKKAFIVVTTSETDATDPSVLSAFQNGAPRYFAKEYDLNVAGLKADTNAGGIKDLSTVTATTDVPFVNGASIKEAYASLTEQEATAWVISSKLKSSITMLDATETERKLSDELTRGTLMGLPVHVFSSQVELGFLRDFSLDEWALLDNEVKVRVARDGIVVDSKGETHNLTQENKVAYILEGFYSHYADVENATVRLTADVSGE